MAKYNVVIDIMGYINIEVTAEGMAEAEEKARDYFYNECDLGVLENASADIEAIEKVDD